VTLEQCGAWEGISAPTLQRAYVDIVKALVGTIGP
jgi:hypothetical protein